MMGKLSCIEPLKGRLEPALSAAEGIGVFLDTLTITAKEGTDMQLKGTRVIALGERDGVQGAAIANCARSSGAEVVLEMTHCFV